MCTPYKKRPARRTKVQVVTDQQDGGQRSTAAAVLYEADSVAKR